MGALLEQQTPFVLEVNGSTECHTTCNSLSRVFGENAYYSDQPHGFSETYFSQQQREVVPACVILPTSAEDVSQALKIIKDHQCIFAVKSGGHAMFAGASNAPQGVTIDLRHLNGLEVAEDRSTTFVGTGNRWRDVYQRLEPMNLTVVGGGISFVSRRYGWGLDNVRNFEVVLANGSISNVSSLSHPDLYFSLRGGGNNFGIVTRFDLETYSQGPIWGGHSFYLLKDVPARKNSMGIYYPFDWTPRWFVDRLSSWAVRTVCRFGYCSAISELAQILEDFSRGESDPLGQIILSFAFLPIVNIHLACLNLMHGRPEANPSVFKDFEDLKSVYTTNRITNLTRINSEIDWMNVIGYRQSWATATFMNVSGLLPSLILQVITKEEILAFSKNGGNALGITDENGPLLLMCNAIRWNYAADDDAVHTANNNFIVRSIALAKEMQVYHRFTYQNYANQSQDVFGGYGPESRERLLQIQKKYDPETIFARLQPGYFKL